MLLILLCLLHIFSSSKDMPYVSSRGDIRRDGDARSRRRERSDVSSSFENGTIRKFVLCLLAALFLAFRLNPSQASLSTFLANRTSGSTAAILTRVFSKETYTRNVLYSEATAGGEYFVGLLGFWFEDPRVLLQKNLSAYDPKAVELLALSYVVVYLGWCTLPYYTMQTHFTLTRRGFFSNGRWYTAATVVVSHSEPLHLLMNLATLLSVGTEVEARLGIRRFAVLYFLAALCGSAASLAGHPSGNYCSLGASGALFGLSGYFAATASEHHEVLLYGFTMSPTQALIANLALSAGLVNNRSGTDNWMHLGGALAGAVLFPWLLTLRLGWL